MQELTDAQKEYFKDSKIRNNKGELVKCFHYTDNEFDSFDKNYITDDSYCGKGFYFTSMNSFAGCFGKNKLECYINMKNPLIVEELDYFDKKALLNYFAESEDYKNGYLPRIEDHPTNYEIIQAEYFIDMLEYIDMYNIENTELIDLIDDLKTSCDYSTFKETKDIVPILDNSNIIYDLLQYEEFVEILKNDNLYDFINDYVNDFECLYLNDLTGDKFHRGYWYEFNELLTEWAKEHEYEGILSEKTDDFEIREIVVFKPNQIKSIDNLYPTKDDNFKDNSREYFKLHSQSLDEKLKAADKKVNRSIKETDIKNRER